MELAADLKPREIEVLRLMAEGLTNREIAERLYLGVETVRWYSKQIYSKLGVSGRAEAAVQAHSLGLLDKTPTISPAPTARSKINLPTQLTTFIGREAQLAEIVELLMGSRLLTLIGPGGTGKTRLSIQAAERVATHFADGVYFIDLAPITDPGLVPNTIAQALNILDSGDEPIIDTIKQIIGQRSMLLILDNYEHVITAAGIVSKLLADTLNIKIIVTSREPLRVSGEQIYPVPPMTVGGTDDLQQSEAMTLFMQRAQAVRPGFHLTETNSDTVTEICQRLDGMPLAIELAAALSRFLTPEAILAQMSKRFDVLKGGSRDAPARQQTLRSTIDWGYDLLSDGEKILFARLAVFRGGRSLDAIEAVCSEGLPIAVFDGLAALVDKSMIHQIEDEQDEPRFVMLETIQEYATERLNASGEAQELRRRHAEYFADLTKHAASFLRRTGQEYWFPRLSIEYDNIRAALQWTLLGGDPVTGIRIVVSLRDYWFYEGQHIEGQRWIEQAFEHIDDIELTMQAQLFLTAGWIANGRQELNESVSSLERGLELIKQDEHAHEMAWLKMSLSQSLFEASGWSNELYPKSVALCEESIAMFRDLNDKSGLSQALNCLGNTHRNQGQHMLAIEVYEECLKLNLETGERRREVMTLSNLAQVEQQLGHYEEANQLFRRSVQLAYEIGFIYILVQKLASNPLQSITSGDYERDARVMGAGHALMKAMNIRIQPNDLRFSERNITRIRDAMGGSAFEAAFAEGSKLSLEEAVELALRED